MFKIDLTFLSFRISNLIDTVTLKKVKSLNLKYNLKNIIMGNTTDGFGKKRDNNQYGEVEKEEQDKRGIELPKSPNKGAIEEE